jgi:hypothetical protein
MSHLQRHRPGWRTLLPLTAILLASLVPHASATSKTVVAVLGDPAPGGGVFAGPGFTGWPSASGNGWIAFRGQISGGGTSEAVIVSRMVSPGGSAQAASIGQVAPGGGTFKQFVGRPTVNANGDVAFLAQVTLADGEDPTGPTPAGIFLYSSNGTLRVVARSGQQTSAGTLDLLGAVGPSAGANETQERPPALNDAGDVAFVTGLQDNPLSNGAIMIVGGDGTVTPLAKVGDPFDGGAFLDLGPPAVNNTGQVVFHAIVATTDPGESDGVIDGIFRTVGAGPPEVLVRDGEMTSVNLPLQDFEDPLALNDSGDIAFFAGPLYDPSDGIPEDRSPGLLVYQSGMVIVVTYPGRDLGTDPIGSFRLGPAAGSGLAAPSIAPGGQVAFFASLARGSREAIAVWEGNRNHVRVYTGGFSPSTTPADGVYAGAQSAPAIDATGSVVFLARIAGGLSSQAIVYQPDGGRGVPIIVGDAAPSTGYFAGHPFFNPLINDRGEVVFRADLARGPSSVGIFRARNGFLEALVLAGDPSPLDGQPFVDLLGQPSLNQSGDVAFAGQVAGQGVGIFVADANGLRVVAAPNYPAPGDAGTVFRSVSPNPSIADDGTVAFRATTLLVDSEAKTRTTRAGIFLSDTSGIHPVVWVGDEAPDGLPFASLGDPVAADLPNVAFRASLASLTGSTVGLFVADGNGISTVARESDVLSSGVTLSHFSGDPVATAGGQLAFVGIRTHESQPGLRKIIGPAILEQTPDGLGLVVAQGMPGPAGGTFRNLAGPTLNSVGHLAFRASFLPSTGGIGGIFLANQAGLEPYLSVGEVSPIGGRFASFGGRASLNTHDDLAFTATITRGRSSTGVFVASRTSLGVRGFALRLPARHGRDRISSRLVLRPGRFAADHDPTREALTVSLADRRGALWSATITSGHLKRRGRSFVAVSRSGSALPGHLSALRLRIDSKGQLHVSMASASLDLTQGGLRPIQGPMSITLQLGDDSGTRVLSLCPLSTRGVRCDMG